MKYSIITCINGNFIIEAEGYTDVSKAKVKFHQTCTDFWSAKDVITGYVIIADENLDKVEGYGEYIWHEPEPVVEPVVESVPTEEPIAEEPTVEEPVAE